MSHFRYVLIQTWSCQFEDWELLTKKEIQTGTDSLCWGLPQLTVWLNFSDKFIHMKFNAIVEYLKKSYPIRNDHLWKKMAWTQSHQFFNWRKNHLKLRRSLSTSEEEEKFRYWWSIDHPHHQTQRKKSWTCLYRQF